MKYLLIILLTISALQATNIDRNHKNICETQVDIIREGKKELFDEKALKFSCKQAAISLEKKKDFKEAYIYHLLYGNYKYVLLQEKLNLQKVDNKFAYIYANILDGNFKVSQKYFKTKDYKQCKNVNEVLSALYPSKKKNINIGLKLCEDIRTKHMTLVATYKNYIAVRDKKRYKKAEESLKSLVSKQKEFDIYHKTQDELNFELAVLYAKSKEYQKSLDILKGFKNIEEEYSSWILYNNDMLGNKTEVKYLDKTKSYSRDMKLGTLYCSELKQYEDGILYLNKALSLMFKDDRATTKEFLSVYMLLASS